MIINKVLYFYFLCYEIIIFFSLSANVQANSENFALVQLCNYHKGKISVDGKLTVEEWGDSSPIGGFGKGVNRQLVFPQTLVYTQYCDDALYIGIIAYENDISAVKSSVRNRDGRGIWWDDCIEIFIDPQRTEKRYYHLIFNCAGIQYDEQACVGRKPAISWNYNWRCVVRKEKDRWTAEIKIPFDNEYFHRPKNKNDVWGVNYCRHRTVNPAYDSSWANLSENYHQPKRFGYLLFVKNCSAINEEFYKLVAKNIGKSVRFFLQNGFVQISKENRIERRNYIDEQKRLMKELKHWIGKLQRELNDRKFNNQFNKLLTRFKSIEKAMQMNNAPAILQWVYSLSASKTLNDEFEDLYWQSKLEQIYKELNK